jgi:hypothetical protein
VFGPMVFFRYDRDRNRGRPGQRLCSVLPVFFPVVAASWTTVGVGPFSPR